MIVVAGEALIDLMLHPDGRSVAVPGGGPYNTARTIGRLGGEVAFLGRLSTDRFGRQLRDALAADGVDLTWAAATEEPTTLAIAELDAAGTATYRFHLAETSAPGLTLAEVSAALRRAPAAFHLGTLGLVVEPMASALAAGVAGVADTTLVMVDPNCRPRVIRDRPAYLARLRGVLARADVVKVSGDDLAFLDPGVDALSAARRLLSSGARVVLLTDAARAVVILTPAFEATLPVPHVSVVDSVGAGDSFGGGFLAEWVRSGHGRADLADRDALESAVRFAIRVAGLTVGRAGADPPTRAELV